MNWTPGPWEATDLSGKPINDPAVMSKKHCVATVWINDISRKQACANARLISAAPDLLAACQYLIAQLEDALAHQRDADGRVFVSGKSDLELKPDGSYLLSQARAAIMKATGAP